MSASLKLKAVSAPTLAFLETLYGNKLKSDNLLVWTKNKNADGGKSYWFDDLDKAAKFAEKTSAATDVYFGIALAKEKPKVKAEYVRVKEKDVAALACLWCEVDYLDGVAHKKKNIPTTPEEARALIHEMPCKPSIVIFSGHGFQAYWLFDELLRLETPEERTKIKALNEQWQRLHKRNAEAHGWDNDSTFDLARIYRLPQTKNHKRPDAIKTVSVIEESDTRYTVEELQVMISALPVPVEATHTKQQTQLKAREAEADALILDQKAEPPQPKFYLLCEAVPEFARKYERKMKLPVLDQSSSSYDYSLCNYMDDAGFTDQEMTDTLISGRRLHGDDLKLREDYYANTIAGVKATRAKVPALQLAPAPQSEAIEEPEHLTDLGNAKRLVRHHGADLRYCFPLKSWLVWNGRRWLHDDTDEAMRRAKATVKTIFIEASEAATVDEAKALAKWAIKSQSKKNLTDMVTLTQSELTIPVLPNELDADPFLFNCANGTLDLRSGVLREHRREDLITKLSPVIYDADARDEVFEKFLDDSTGGDEQLKTFVQRAAGYSLTGDTREEVLFFIYGSTASGKSTLVDALKATLGEEEYAKTADFEAFLARKNVGGARNDIADLAGARFVASIEVDEGKKLAEGLIKMITGGDTVKARFLHQNLFAFRPTFKLWLAANHTPKVRDDDDAMWRRILTVPFTHTVEKSKRDPRVKAHLKDVAASGASILAWMVQGCLDWQRDGLRVPQAVEDATADFRESQDPLKDFLSECCTLAAPLAWTSSAEIRAEYEKFNKERGERHTLSANDFAARLKAQNCSLGKRNGVRGWLGIGLLS
jgi:putative DNA primase/helicase